MRKTRYAVAEYATGEDIKRLRMKLNMTQKSFASFIGSSKPTIERWESGKGKITGPVVLLIQMLEDNLDYLKRIEVPEKVFPTRMWYMYNQTICTLIDVNELERKVHIKNYTNNIMLRAFGVNDHPSYEQYQDFLESRCFPKERDKMKLILRDLDLPFYDAFMIIEKTEGRMAEDDFWIKIEE